MASQHAMNYIYDKNAPENCILSIFFKKLNNEIGLYIF